MNKTLSRSLIGLLLIGLCSSAIAATVLGTVKWSIPTTRADGTALAASEIASYEILYSIDSGTITTVNVPGGSVVTKAITLNLAPRSTKYRFVLQMTATDTGGRKSERSASVIMEIDVPVAAPNPPGNVTITVTCNTSTGACTGALAQ